MSMDKKLTSAVYAAVEKAYDHRCDIEDAADEILEIIKADRKRRGEPVGYVSPSAIKRLKAGGNAIVGGMSQGFDVPLYAAPQPAEPVSQHPDDAAVDAFAVAMKAKLAKKRTEGRGNWQMCTSTYLSRLLREHVEKGDPVDVANLAMMLSLNGQRIAPDEPVKVPSDDEIRALAKNHMRAHAQFVGAGEVWYEGEVEFARALLARYTTTKEQI